MNKTSNFKLNFKINQPKLFNLIHFEIPNNDPVVELKNILEVLDLSSLKKVFHYKTKVPPVRILSVIIYAFSNKITSTREIEKLCKENIKYMYLDDSITPDHTTICRFMKKCNKIIDDIFIKFNNELIKRNNISTEDIRTFK